MNFRLFQRYPCAQTVKVDGQPAGILEAPDKICKDDGEACEIFTATHGATCSMKCAEAGLVCQDGWVK